MIPNHARCQLRHTKVNWYSRVGTRNALCALHVPFYLLGSRAKPASTGLRLIKTLLCH